jgi:hypothetical protein
MHATGNKQPAKALRDWLCGLVLVYYEPLFSEERDSITALKKSSFWGHQGIASTIHGAGPANW